MATKILKNNKWILFCLIALLFLMLVLIRPIKASFIVLLNPILNHLPTADYQQNSFFEMIPFLRACAVFCSGCEADRDSYSTNSEAKPR